MAQKTSELWKNLLHTPGTHREYKFEIDGTEYGPEAEVSHSVENGLFDEFGFGNASCAQLTLSLLAEDIPRSATIKRYVRLVNGEQTSEWLPAGVFFTNRRSVEDGYWEIEAFDAMRKADQPWEPDQSIRFPLPMPDAVNEFCRIMGCELDERTVLNPEYTIDYPASDPESESGEFYTIRQELQWIAAAHGGNWIMTPSGKLRLIQVERISPVEEEVLGTEDGDILDFGGFALDVRAKAADGGEEQQTSHDCGQDLVSASNNGLAKPISRITLLRDDENAVTAGDDTGLELSADCPFATQAMADGILARLVGYQYRMFEAAAVNISPAAELGDLIEADGIYSVVAQISDDGSGYPDIAAPGEAEMEDEFPTGAGPVTREFNRKIAQTRSAIEKSAEQIRLYVENNVTEALAEVDVSLDAIGQRITDGEARTSEIETKVDGIRLETATEAGADGQVYARITLKIGPNSYSGYIKMEGNVDVSGQLSADALYAALGDIADLTVDRLSTTRRIVKYLASDTSDDNYVRVQDQYIEFVTGTTDGSEEQAVNPSGMPIYWEDDPDGASLGSDGYPYRDGTRIFTTTAKTPWPVMVYVYEELVKRSIGFEDIDGIYTPVDTFGAGNTEGTQQGRLVKRKKSMELIFVTSTKKVVGLNAVEEGYLDLYGLRRTTGLDFSQWDAGTFTETVEGETEPYGYQVAFDGQGRPVKITDADGKSTDIRW